MMRESKAPVGREGPQTGARAASPEKLHAVLDALPAMVGYWGRDLRNQVSNAAYGHYFGLSPEQILGMHVRDLLGPELYAKNNPHILGALDGEAQEFERDITTPAGVVHHTHASYVPDMVDGIAHGFFVLVTDVTERRAAEQRREAAERRFRELFASAPIGTFLLGDDLTILDANQAAVELLGRSRPDLVGGAALRLVHHQDVEAGERALRDLLDGRVETCRVEQRLIHSEGGVVWVQVDARLLSSQDGTRQLVAQVQDVSERRRHESELELIATHDALTALLNRRGLFEVLERECGRNRRYEGHAALLLIDVDHFKRVNDTLGHHLGDRTLVEVAGILGADK